jgi:thiopurine S-methyltransferase
MDQAFWNQRWADGRTGWHQQEVDRLLQKHWPALGIPADAPVLVPLCGKSLDLAWLASRGHPVRGVELSRLACSEFFADHRQRPTVEPVGPFEVFRSEHIELLCGDIFDLPDGALSDIAAVYDRAALIALPADLRRRYADELYRRLRPGCRGLLITLEYPPQQRSGPPFSVAEAEVRSLFEPEWQVELAERRDILDAEPRFREEGLSALSTAVYRLMRRGPG